MATSGRGVDELWRPGPPLTCWGQPAPAQSDKFVQVDVAALPKAETVVVAAVNDGLLALEVPDRTTDTLWRSVKERKRRIFSVAKRSRHWPMATKEPDRFHERDVQSSCLRQTASTVSISARTLSVSLDVQASPTDPRR